MTIEEQVKKHKEEIRAAFAKGMVAGSLLASVIMIGAVLLSR